MNYDKIRSSKRQKPHMTKNKENIDGSDQPLRKVNNLPNSIHPNSLSPEDDNGNPSQKKTNQQTRIRLSQIPHIDSSSEEDLEARQALDHKEEIVTKRTNF